MSGAGPVDLLDAPEPNTAPGVASGVALGVALVADGIAARLPEQLGGIVFKCAQNATAAYAQNGFKAAAVTAMAWMDSATAKYVERKIRHVQVPRPTSRGHRDRPR